MGYVKCMGFGGQLAFELFDAEVSLWLSEMGFNFLLCLAVIVVKRRLPSTC